MCKAEHNVKVATIVLNKVSTTYKNEKANSKLFAAMVKASAEAAGAGFDVKAQVGDSALKEQWTTEEQRKLVKNWINYVKTICSFSAPQV